MAKCKDNMQCLYLNLFCDDAAHPHCRDQSDEDPEVCRGKEYLVSHCNTLNSSICWIIYQLVKW
jgi:hypothetical protein